MRALNRSLICSGLLVLGACFGTSTGNPIGGADDGPNGGQVAGPGGSDEAGTGGAGGLGTGNAGSGSCHVVSATEIAPDADTSLGFKANDVLAFVEGAHSEQLTWNPQERLEYGPESGQHVLTLEITRKGAPRLTHYAPNAGPFGEIALAGGDGAGGYGCSDAIEIDVQVRIKSDQGALDETFDSTIVARSDKAVSIYHRVKDDKLNGSFAVTKITPVIPVNSPPSNASEPRLIQLTFSIQLTKYGTQGSFTGTIEQRFDSGISSASGGGGAAGSAPLARWGLADCLYRGASVPMSAQAAAFSGDDLLTLLNRNGKGTVTFDGSAASSATLAFSAASERACVVLENNGATMGGPGTVYIQASLRIQSADGRIDGSWPLEITALPDQTGQIDQAQISFDNDRLPAGRDFAQYGVTGFDASGFDHVAAQLKMLAGSQVGLSGDLTLTGFKNAPCSNEVIMLPGGGMAVNGCAGATATTLGHARITGSQP
jgi:hypothetical protein